jgi:hypothetical protein
MSSSWTFSRLEPYVDYLLSNPLVPSEIRPEIIIPSGKFPQPLKVPVRVVSGIADTFVGLCRRVAAAFDIFLRETSSPWFFRAIDDTWILPANLIELVEDLEQFVDPYHDIVVKGSKTRHLFFNCSSWMDGGIGWLMSRAAVLHFVEYNFVQVCSRVYLQQDDTTTGLILCHTFPDFRYWDNPRFPGNPYYHSHIVVLNFSEILIPCNGTNIWPINKIVSFHTNGNATLQAFLRAARTAPSDAAFEWHPNVWHICRGDAQKFAVLNSLEHLKKWTPIVKFIKSGQIIPWDIHPRFNLPVDCMQCTGLPNESDTGEQQRFIKWTKLGWKGYQKDPFDRSENRNSLGFQTF